MSTFEAFKYRDYRLLWVGNLCTTIAVWIQTTTMSWVAYSLTGLGSTIGIVNAMRMIPTLFMTPISGVTVDRFSRNKIIAVSQLSMFTFTLLLAIDIFLGKLQVWHLFLFALLGGITNTFNLPARQTFVFDIVKPGDLPNAIALDNIAFSSARTLAASGAGALIVAFGAANNFLIQACMYLAIMATVLSIKTKRPQQTSPRRHFFREMIEGYRYASRNPNARLLLLMMVINPMLLIPLHLALLPMFSNKVFVSGAGALGLLLGSLGFGGFFGGLLTASLSKVDRRGLVQLVSLLVHSLAHAGFCVVAYWTGRIWFALPFLVLAGTMESIHMTTNQTVLQLLAPDHLRGRLTSVLQLAQLINPIGIFAAGALADRFGPVAIGVAFSLGGFFMTAAIFVFSSRMRDLRLSELQSLGQQGLDPFPSIDIP
ncbi:MAG TPA: MFS transporter [Acidobacteriota bacterium]|nr:MFS transporter [Acidobacteriota bacterium]